MSAPPKRVSTKGWGVCRYWGVGRPGGLPPTPTHHRRRRKRYLPDRMPDDASDPERKGLERLVKLASRVL